MHLLFTYGTLAPATADVASLRGWTADAVRGRLYDLGTYPALVDQDDDAEWVEGYVRPVSWDQLTGTLDSYEGVDEGLFKRVEVTTRAGRRVWVYMYARPIPPAAIGPLPCWNSTKRVRLIAPPGNPEGAHSCQPRQP
jgi:gamma-glutamylcyclotransferase (GGCT)/AIG2-like uncharacterized protein YtfP